MAETAYTVLVTGSIDARPACLDELLRQSPLALPASRSFVKATTACAAAPPRMALHEVQPKRL